MRDKGVCRRAPATPGLLRTYVVMVEARLTVKKVELIGAGRSCTIQDYQTPSFLYSQAL